MEKLSDMRRKKLDESCNAKPKAEVKKPDEKKPDEKKHDKKFDEAVELLNSCGMIVEAKS